MGLYEAAKDALTVAQKADNIELVQKLLEVQKMALDMQEKQQQLQSNIGKLERELEDVRAARAFQFAQGHNWLVDPEDPQRMLCPVCTPKNRYAIPLNSNGHCSQCKGWYR